MGWVRRLMALAFASAFATYVVYKRCNDFLTVTSLVSQKLSHPCLRGTQRPDDFFQRHNFSALPCTSTSLNYITTNNQSLRKQIYTKATRVNFVESDDVLDSASLKSLLSHSLSCPVWLAQQLLQVSLQSASSPE